MIANNMTVDLYGMNKLDGDQLQGFYLKRLPTFSRSTASNDFYVWQRYKNGMVLCYAMLMLCEAALK